MAASSLSEAQLSLVAKTIGMLSADAVEKAKSGHPGMPMGAADYAAVLWMKYLRFNPRDPKWINRDRFLLSNGHGSMLQYALLHLAGYDVTLDDLKSFRQWESKTPGHPESFMTPGVEATTGPLGQGIANAVGMAIGQKVMAQRFNTPDAAIFDHRVFCFLGDGCMMEGISSEACSVAGHLGLDNLIAIYDDNHISIAGHTDLAFSEDIPKRFESYGWFVQSIDGHDYKVIDEAIGRAIAERGRPSLICARTLIGKGSPNKVDTHDVHGAPLGKDELALTKKALEWPLEPMFFIPEEVQALFDERVKQLQEEHRAWEKTFAEWRKSNGASAAALESQLRLQVPDNLLDELLKAVPQGDSPISTRKLSQSVLQAAAKEVPALIGGSADLEPSTLTLIKDSTDIERGAFAGRNLRFGVREHGMGAIMNGLAYYGGFIPYGSTFLVFSDYMRPTLRLAALSHLPGLFIYTHDSVFLGEDGPTHQPIEHLASLRLIPNLFVMRPADGVETAACYDIALRRTDGPSALVFTRQDLPVLQREPAFDPQVIAKGAYQLYSSGKVAELVFVATGSEVSLALAAAKELAATTAVSVVSMPCWELFYAQPEEYRSRLFPRNARVVTIEAASTLLWTGLLGTDPNRTLHIGIDRFGSSAPAKVIAEKFGFTPEAVTKRVRQHFGL